MYPVWCVGSGFLQMMMFEKTDEDLISEIEGENLKTSLVESFEDSAST